MKDKNVSVRKVDPVELNFYLLGFCIFLFIVLSFAHGWAGLPTDQSAVIQQAKAEMAAKILVDEYRVVKVRHTKQHWFILTDQAPFWWWPRDNFYIIAAVKGDGVDIQVKIYRSISPETRDKLRKLGCEFL